MWVFFVVFCVVVVLVCEIVSNIVLNMKGRCMVYFGVDFFKGFGVFVLFFGVLVIVV